MNLDEKLQEAIELILSQGGNGPVLVMKATMTLQLLNEELDCYHKARATMGAVVRVFRGMHTQQLQYLSSGARSL